MNTQGAAPEGFDITALDPHTLQLLIEDGLQRTNLFVFVMDRQKRCLYMSPSVARLLNVDPRTFIGKYGRELGFSDELVSKVEPLVDLAFASETTVQGELEAVWQGERRYFEYDAFKLCGDGTDPFSIMALVTERTAEKRSREFSEALNRINREICNIQEPGRIMAKVVDIAGTCMGGDPPTIALRDFGTWNLRFNYALPPEARGYRIRWIDGLLDRSLETGEPLIMSDARDYLGEGNKLVDLLDARPLMSFPLCISDKMEGAFIFFRRGEARPYSDTEIDFGGKLATSARAALVNSCMYLEARRSEEEKAALLEQIGSERELLRAMMDNIQVPVAVCEGDDCRMVMYNPSFRVALPPPMNVDCIEGRPARDWLSTEEAEKILKLHREVLRTRKPHFNLEYERPNHEEMMEHFLVSMMPLRGRPDQVLSVSLDVTAAVRDRKMIEDLAIRSDEERKRLRAILETLPVGVLMVDGDGNVAESNDMRDFIWGGNTFMKRIPQDLKNLRGRWADTGIKVSNEEWPIWRAYKFEERVIGAVVDIHRQDETRGTMLLSAAPIYNEGGERTGAVAVMQDITSQRLLEHEAVEAKKRAELYLDILTRDISNYNTVTASIIKMAMTGSSGDGLGRALISLHESSRLIDNVRKLQMVESREMAPTPVDLGRVIEEVVEEQNGQAGGARIAYTPHLRLYVMATGLLKDVFVNLVGNAVKHSGGMANISISLGKAFEDGQEMYKAVIEDDGPGISDEVKSQVFMRKFHGSRSCGCGLGLYLVRRLVEEFKGRVWIEDRVPGDHAKGTRFVVMLPAAGAPTIEQDI